jgi:AcrR family transcriptional regulator
MLDTARKLFAERGFYGVSIANIADEHGLTKQALLHHFESKEKLYGQVLLRIAEEFDQLRAGAHSSDDDPAAQLETLFVALIPKKPADHVRTRLLMRELLDNQERADKAGAWYLKPLLEDLVAMAQALPKWRDATDAQALALVYQLLGAVYYYAISLPTIRGIFGAKRSKAMDDCYAEQFRAVIRGAFARPPE